jgi:DNA polymerase-3 subunit gamma/tau
VVDAIKAKGRVAAIVIGNASVASFDEGVLTLRFPRQGDVKGFQGSKYEELLKQALAAMFGVNVTIRAVTGGGDAASPARRPGPGPAAPTGANGQSPPAGQGQPPSPGRPGTQDGPPAGPPPPPPDHQQQAAPGAAAAVSGHSYAPGAASAAAGPQAGSANGAGGGPHSFGGPAGAGADLPPLPPPPAPDDEDFDPDDEDMSVPVTNELTGMALVQRELGGQVIAEYED